MSEREAILGRIRAARAQPPAEVVVPRDYQRHRDVPEGVVARFCERAADYDATVWRVNPDQVSASIAAALAELGAARVAMATLPEQWRVPGAPQLDSVEAPLNLSALQQLDAVVTGSVVAIAETGTVILDGSPLCGRRALTLVPDAHVCLVAASDIVDDVPAAVAKVNPTAPLTWISGPSATSDIELERVPGVHGPRRLYLLVIESV